VQSDVDCAGSNNKQDKALCTSVSDQSDSVLLSSLHESSATDDHETSTDYKQEWESMGESSEEVENLSEDDGEIGNSRESKNNIRFALGIINPFGRVYKNLKTYIQ
jgi:hypothetical protein